MNILVLTNYPRCCILNQHSSCHAYKRECHATHIRKYSLFTKTHIASCSLFTWFRQASSCVSKSVQLSTYIGCCNTWSPHSDTQRANALSKTTDTNYSDTAHESINSHYFQTCKQFPKTFPPSHNSNGALFPAVNKWRITWIYDLVWVRSHAWREKNKHSLL
jgi:hypothetical protein